MTLTHLLHCVYCGAGQEENHFGEGCAGAEAIKACP